ncbi:MAG: ATP-binding protein, partial [Actinomycetota bacterium]
MELAREIANNLSAAMWILLGLLAVRLWIRHRTRPAAWVAVSFGALAAIVAFSRVMAVAGVTILSPWLIKPLLAMLLLYPYFLFRFASSLKMPPRWMRKIADGLALLVTVVTLLLPHVPTAGEPRSAWWAAFTVLFLGEWSLLSGAVTVRLWGAGRGQPTVVQARMRLLAAGAAGLTLSLVVGSIPGGTAPDWFRLVTTTIGIFAGALFYLAFWPPALFRMSWRRREVDAARVAARDLMTAASVAEVTRRILPQVAGMLGGESAALIASDGRVLGSYGVSRSVAKAVSEKLAGGFGAAHAGPSEPQVLPMELGSGTLMVWASPYAPFFGTEEIELVRYQGVLADLAIARCELFDRERDARVAAEEARTELESFLYSVSHDLRSPLISMLGYLEYLRTDYGQALAGEGIHYLERMTASGAYMQQLIQDLLELSRIGRTQTAVEQVDLTRLATDLAGEVQLAHPGAVFDIGPLPVVMMNPVRARQFLTNVLENCVHHGARPDVHVVARALEPQDGEVVVSIADNGRGIPAQYREKVFGIFERLERPEGAASGGTGIGLAVCRRIMDGLGGRVWFADAAVGADLRAAFP